MRLVEGLQDDARVGLVSFGNNVLVHDFQAKVSTAICFAGDQAYKLTKMADNLGLRINDRGVALEMFQKYLVRVGEQRAKVMKRINTIKRMVR